MPNTAVRIELIVGMSISQSVLADVAREAAQSIYTRTGSIASTSVETSLTVSVEPADETPLPRVFDPYENYLVRPESVVVTQLGPLEMLIEWEPPPVTDWIVGYYVQWATSGNDQQNTIVGQPNATLTFTQASEEAAVVIMPFYGYDNLSFAQAWQTFPVN